jgi:hypothetical protein
MRLELIDNIIRHSEATVNKRQAIQSSQSRELVDRKRSVQLHIVFQVQVEHVPEFPDRVREGPSQIVSLKIQLPQLAQVSNPVGQWSLEMAIREKQSL